MKVVILLSFLLLVCLFMSEVEAHSEPLKYFLHKMKRFHKDQKYKNFINTLKKSDKYFKASESVYLKNVTNITNGGDFNFFFFF